MPQLVARALAAEEVPVTQGRYCLQARADGEPLLQARRREVLVGVEKRLVRGIASSLYCYCPLLAHLI